MLPVFHYSSCVFVSFKKWLGFLTLLRSFNKAIIFFSVKSFFFTEKNPFGEKLLAMTKPLFLKKQKISTGDQLFPNKSEVDKKHFKLIKNVNKRAQYCNWNDKKDPLLKKLFNFPWAVPVSWKHKNLEIISMWEQFWKSYRQMHWKKIGI